MGSREVRTCQERTINNKRGQRLVVVKSTEARNPPTQTSLPPSLPPSLPTFQTRVRSPEHREGGWLIHLHVQSAANDLPQT